MSVYHSASYLYGYKLESAYAAGNGTTELECDPFAAGEVANLSSMPFPMGEQGFPKINYERDYVKGASLGADSVIQFVKGLKYEEFTIKQYVQDLSTESYWLDQAFQSLTAGSLPNSWVFHLETADDQFDICGCVITKYVLEIPEGNDFISESITFMYYKIVDSVAVTNFSSSCGFLGATVPPKIKEDIALTLDSDVLSTYLKNSTLTITIEHEDSTIASRLERFPPYVLKRSTELGVNLLVDAAAQARLVSSTSTNLITGILSINGGTDTWTITNLRTEESDANKVPEYGLKTWDLKLVNGGTCVYTRSA